MRAPWPFVLIAIAACGSSSPPAQLPVTESPPPEGAPPPAEPPPAPPAKPVAQKLAADTPSTTAAGNTFIAPAGWTLTAAGKATILEAPEGDSRIAFVDVQAKDADAALAEAWTAYGRGAAREIEATTTSADKDGWQDQRQYKYKTSPNEKRGVTAGTRRHGEQWTVAIVDMADAVAGKRGAQVSLIFGRFLPKGYVRETFAGRTANPLDAARIKELGAFVERAQQALGVPGVSIGLVQNGKVVFAGGFGVRELGKPTKVDADSLYIIASNTKAMTTLMLGKLVDENKLTWDTPVTSLLPAFKLGDGDTTSKVLVKHLICACTGLPRQDLEFLLEFKRATAASSLATLATMQPTTKFGEMYQYSNPLAAAAGYVGGYVSFPKLELGAAYDQAMKTRVFGPLGMTATTFDFARAQRANHARPHAFDIDAKVAVAPMSVNGAIVPVRPAGGAWSNVRDVLKYVQMELAKGALPNGKRYVSEAVLAARTAPQIPIGKDATYGMGIRVETTYGTPVVNHGGSMIGYKSNMLWLPEHGVGAVILTNADSGGAMLGTFTRKLLEVLFDGKPEADAQVAAAGKQIQDSLAAERKQLTVPPDPAEVAKLAAHYVSPVLGDIRITTRGGVTTADFGEWKSAVASRKHPDGTVSFYTTTAGVRGFDLVVGTAAGKRTLTLRDAQHEYVFTEK